MSASLDWMPVYPSMADILLRIILSVVAGAVIGFNRQRGGHAAGFRTTILITLAACLAMIQANMLLGVAGKTPDSFAVMDTLRFPLGVLTGVGFIGGGAILRGGDAVTGVTTAATIWVMTAIGLCIGGGQIFLGIGATLVALIVLAPLKFIDQWLERKTGARMTLRLAAGADPFAPVTMLENLGYAVQPLRVRRIDDGGLEATFELKWHSRDIAGAAEKLYADVNANFMIKDCTFIPTAT